MASNPLFINFERNFAGCQMQHLNPGSVMAASSNWLVNMDVEEYKKRYKNLTRPDLIALAEKQRKRIAEAKRVLKAIEDLIIYRAENDLP